jgi:hypothetical protein
MVVTCCVKFIADQAKTHSIKVISCNLVMFQGVKDGTPSSISRFSEKAKDTN